jgi:exopolysaccharide biosynthesis polyprenyl glycosylphosphotransferase
LIEGLASYGRQRSVFTKRYNRAEWENALSFTALLGDFAMVLLGFLVAFWLRYESGWVFEASDEVALADYWPLLLFGSVAVFWGMVGKGMCAYQDLLTPTAIQGRLFLVLSVCLFAFIGVSLVVHTTPAISRSLVFISWFTIFFAVYGWRLLLRRIIQMPALALRLRKRLVVIGTGPETMQIQQRLTGGVEMQFIGWIQTNKPNKEPSLDRFRLGSLHELGSILKNVSVDVAILADSESLQHEAILYIARVCENEHVQFKVVPHFFEVLISGLRPSVIGGVSVLGVENLPLSAYQNQLAKRIFDLVGATLGMLVAAPIIAVFGALVWCESPGPIIYRQVRSGRNGRPFEMLKIRSMRINAEGDGKARWCVENDPRRLKIGAFMRRWNIDEIPQFWNVLKGDMSLIGPRPERPELIEHFKAKIPHYQARHTCLPGMSGWAQVNGLRGNTSLEDRIRLDIWYVENWSLVLDFRILAMTFIHQQNAY